MEGDISTVLTIMPPTPSSTSPLSNASPSSKKYVNTDRVLELVGQKLKNSRFEDEYNIIGRNVARKMQKIFTEKLINNTFFNAQLGTFNRHAFINHLNFPQSFNYSIALFSLGSSYYNLQTVNPQSNAADLVGQYQE